MLVSNRSRARELRITGNCYDAVALVQVTDDQKMRPQKRDPNDLIGHEIYDIRVNVVQVISGSIVPGPMTVSQLLHVGLRPHLALETYRLLTDGSYVVTSGWWVERDVSGQYVIPVHGPENLDPTDPMDLIGPDYEAWLKPIDYQPAEYDKALPGWIAAIDPAWEVARGDQILARRGVFLDDIPAMLDARHLRCAPIDYSSKTPS